jgi:hypothetical protein
MAVAATRFGEERRFNCRFLITVSFHYRPMKKTPCDDPSCMLTQGVFFIGR